MSIADKISSAFVINYKNLSQEDKESVYAQFKDECVARINWVTAVSFFGEILLVILDLRNRFFDENPLNYLNLVAEILIIVSSLITNVACDRIMTKQPDNTRAKAIALNFYKICLFIALTLFIFTDIYVRHTPLGAYVVFMFIFQIVPFYKAKENILWFGAFIAIIVGLYFGCVPDTHGNTIFSIVAIFIAFCMSTECLRAFFIKKIINNRMSHLMAGRFENLAGQSIMALSNAVEAKDLYTKGHSQRVAKYSREIAKRLGFEERYQEEVYYIGLLHDIGKIGVRDTVINKRGYLEDDEFEEIKKHPVMGYDILKNITEIPDIGMGARWHHERFDGKGYPDGLSGEDIPLIARIIAVADAYDAMTSNRSYRDLLPQEVVRGEIEKNIGKQFAPEIAKIMLEMIDEDVEYTMHE